MPGSLFISYRRKDGAKDARALYERLRHEFGEQYVFIDLHSIEPGEDFLERLERQLDSCTVMVALIGHRWLDMRNALGTRRLDDKRDFVRIEVATALKRGIRVIPVLVDGATMPTPKQLPPGLKRLARRQAVAICIDTFDVDAERVVLAVRKEFASPVYPPARDVIGHTVLVPAAPESIIISTVSEMVALSSQHPLLLFAYKAEKGWFGEDNAWNSFRTEVVPELVKIQVRGDLAFNIAWANLGGIIFRNDLAIHFARLGLQVEGVFRIERGEIVAGQRFALFGGISANYIEAARFLIAQGSHA